MAYKILNQNTPRIRGVLFDMDGLVLDSEKLYCRFWMEAAEQFGFSMTWEQALQMRGLSGPAGEAKIRSFFGLTADYQQIRTERIRRMDAYVAEHGIELKPGVRELLSFLRERELPCAITSSSPKQRIHRYLTWHGIAGEFTALCSGHEVKNGKPAPDIYLLGARTLGLAPEDCLALEDAPAGIESAFRAGCHPVLVPDLDVPQKATLCRCFAQADSLLDVRDLLDREKQ